MYAGDVCDTFQPMTARRPDLADANAPRPDNPAKLLGEAADQLVALARQLRAGGAAEAHFGLDGFGLGIGFCHHPDGRLLAVATFEKVRVLRVLVPPDGPMAVQVAKPGPWMDALRGLHHDMKLATKPAKPGDVRH